MTRPRALAAALPVLALAALAGCLIGCGGAAAPSAAAPSSASLVSEDLSTPEGALAAVNQAERSIDQLVGPNQNRVISQRAGAFAQAPPMAPAQPTEPSPPPPPPPPPAPTVADSAPQAEVSTPQKTAKKNAGGGAPRAAPASGGESCSTACSALASMERATEHLCTLAGAADGRCTSARSRVQSATERVRAACPVCGG